MRIGSMLEAVEYTWRSS